MNKIMLNVADDAKCAIGFTESISCEAANTWTEKFCYYYSLGYSIKEAAEVAKDETSKAHWWSGIESMVVKENPNI